MLSTLATFGAESGRATAWSPDSAWLAVIVGGATPLLIRPDKPAELWVCNDAGVFVTDDAGATWRNGTGNLPPAMIVDLVFHTASKTLLAATYGRSIWRLKLA